MTRRALFMATGANRGAWYAGLMGPLAEADIEIGRREMSETIDLAQSNRDPVAHGERAGELRRALG